jgi:hypothetical protein
MRPLVPLLVLGLSAACHADRLITIPTARKLLYRSVRAETFIETGSGRTWEGFLGIGIGKSFEAEIHTERFPGKDTRTAFDLTYNHVAPILGYVPGLAAGVQDVFDSSRDGRRFWAATTYRKAFKSLDGVYFADLTVGGFVGKKTSPFAGVSVPISRYVRVLAEHNGYRLSSGLEIRPKPQFALRLVFRERDSLLGLSLATKF